MIGTRNSVHDDPRTLVVAAGDSIAPQKTVLQKGLKQLGDGVPWDGRKRKKTTARSQNREFHASHSSVWTVDRKSVEGETIDIGLPRNLPEPHPENSDIRFHLHQARP